MVGEEKGNKIDYLLSSWFKEKERKKNYIKFRIRKDVVIKIDEIEIIIRLFFILWDIFDNLDEMRDFVRKYKVLKVCKKYKIRRRYY